MLRASTSAAGKSDWASAARGTCRSSRPSGTQFDLSPEPQPGDQSSLTLQTTPGAAACRRSDAGEGGRAKQRGGVTNFPCRALWESRASGWKLFTCACGGRGAPAQGRGFEPLGGRQAVAAMVSGGGAEGVGARRQALGRRGASTCRSQVKQQPRPCGAGGRPGRTHLLSLILSLVASNTCEGTLRCCSREDHHLGLFGALFSCYSVQRDRLPRPPAGFFLLLRSPPAPCAARIAAGINRRHFPLSALAAAADLLRAALYLLLLLQCQNWGREGAAAACESVQATRRHTLPPSTTGNKESWVGGGRPHFQSTSAKQIS